MEQRQLSQLEMKQKENEENPGKFAHNWKVRDDDSFQEFRGYSIKDGLDKAEPFVLSRRMKILLSSGIYWFWEKWDGLQTQHQGKTKNNETNTRIESESKLEGPWSPLSFQDSGSDIGRIFYYFISALLISTLFWLLELLIHFVAGL